MRRLWLFLKRRLLPQADWNEELRRHQEMRAEWLQERGHSFGEAKTLAQRAFGNELRWSETVREVYPAHLLQDFVQDVRHGIRMLWRQTGFTGSVALTMILAIASATTIFSVVDPLLFQPLPFTDGNRLVSVGMLGPIDTNEFAMGSMYLDWRQHQTAFTAMTAMRPGTQCDLELPQLQHVPCVAVERSFLPTLGVRPILGRNFDAAEDDPHGPDAVLISDRLWRSVLGSAPDVLNRLVKLDDKPTRIVGVLPASFVLPQGGEADLLQPAKLDPAVLLAPDATVFLRTFARLRPDLSLAAARARMQVLIQHSIETQVPPSLRREVRPVIRSVRDRSIQEAKLSSFMLLGAVGLLLLLACFTIANLFLARAAARQEELSMRTMLGASRGRLSRQVTSELLLLCVPGGLLGCVLGVGATRFLVHVAPQGFRGLATVRVNGRVILFALLMTFGVALLSGLLPVFRKTTVTIVRSWQSMSFERAVMRQALVAGQLTVSLVLLTGACLFGRSLQKLQSEAVGFSADHLLAVSIDLPHGKYSDSARERGFCNEIERRLRQIPGVTEVALSDSMPPSGGMHGRPLANLMFEDRRTVNKSGMVAFRYVTPSYFRTLRIPLLAGRSFTEGERQQAQSTLVISEGLARQLFNAGVNPLGKRISLDGGTQWVRIIGVTRDVKNDGIATAPWPEYFVLRTTDNVQLRSHVVAFVRSQLDVPTVSSFIQRQVQAADPSVAFSIEAMEERVRRLSDSSRFLVMVMGVFAATSLFLAGSGLFGVVSFLVQGRRRELGIRAALGASRRDVLVLVQRQTLPWILSALLVGLTLSALFARLVRGLLFQVTPTDPFLLGISALLLFVVTMVAIWQPTLRAMRIDPVDCLRAE